MTKREEIIGICKICLQEKELSEDHVPPQGGIVIEPIEIRNAFDSVLKANLGRDYYISQNGVKFKTICKECNSKLGRLYDKDLNEFSIGVGRYISSSLKTPEVIRYRTKPNSIIRAILGHLLAVKSELDDLEFDN
ncbi:MAG: hypothetical protein ACTSRU_20900, partial [Candidatus Hodarchaeales archaeon]